MKSYGIETVVKAVREHEPVLRAVKEKDGTVMNSLGNKEWHIVTENPALRFVAYSDPVDVKPGQRAQVCLFIETETPKAEPDAS